MIFQVDVTILTTGQSSSGRKRRQEVWLKTSTFNWHSTRLFVSGCCWTQSFAEEEDQSGLNKHRHLAQGRTTLHFCFWPADAAGVQGVSRFADYKGHVRGCSQRFAGGPGFHQPSYLLCSLSPSGDLEEQEQCSDFDSGCRRRLEIIFTWVYLQLAPILPLMLVIFSGLAWHHLEMKTAGFILISIIILPVPQKTSDLNTSLLETWTECHCSQPLLYSLSPMLHFILYVIDFYSAV